MTPYLDQNRYIDPLSGITFLFQGWHPLSREQMRQRYVVWRRRYLGLDLQEGGMYFVPEIAVDGRDPAVRTTRVLATG